MIQALRKTGRGDVLRRAPTHLEQSLPDEAEQIGTERRQLQVPQSAAATRGLTKPTRTLRRGDQRLHLEHR